MSERGHGRACVYIRRRVGSADDVVVAVTQRRRDAIGDCDKAFSLFPSHDDDAQDRCSYKL